MEVYMKSGKIWVILAESSRARIFELDKLYSPLEELEGFVNNNCRLHETELNSDKPGHSFDSRGASSHQLGQFNDTKTHQTEVFAKLLSDRLDKGRISGEFEKLIIIAPPSFLGILRKIMPHQIKQLVWMSMPKNIVREDTATLRAMLNKSLPGAYKISTRH